MDRIRQYHKLSEVKPDYYKLEIPILKPSHKRLVFTTKELQMWLHQEFGVYTEKKSKIGGSTGVTCACLDF
jgi:hypothetical protein